MKKSFILNGGEKFIKYSKTNENLDDLVSEVNSLNPDLILICANSVDAAKSYTIFENEWYKNSNSQPLQIDNDTCF